MDRRSAHEIRRGIANRVSPFQPTNPLSHPLIICRAQRDIVADLKRQQNEIEREMVTARARVDACKQALVRHGRAEKDLLYQMQRMAERAEELKDTLDKENAEDGRIDALLAALKEAEEEKQLNEGSLNDSEAAMKAMMQTLKEVRRELLAQDADLETLREKHQVAESEQRLVKTKQTKLIDEKNAAIALIDQDKQTKIAIEAKKDQVKARVLEYNEKASMVSPRVPVDEGETPASLDRKLDRLGRDLERYNLEYVLYLAFVSSANKDRLGSSREEIAAEATRTAAAYNRAMQQLEQFSTLSQVSCSSRSHCSNLTTPGPQRHPSKPQETMGDLQISYLIPS